MRRWPLVTSLLFVVLALAPLYLAEYDLTLIGRFLSLGIAAMGIVLVWGRSGVLPLGQGAFFALGGYALAMHLKLKALGPDELPDFMIWNGVEKLPMWWVPFRSAAFALVAVIALPSLAAALLGWLVFRRRTTSVYIALITQALALALPTLLTSQQGTTGGFNGLTNFNTLFGVPLASHQARIGLHLATVALAAAAFYAARALDATQAGTLTIAVRDGENRVRFLGYNPTPYKMVAFGLAAAFAGVGGALHTLHLGVISPAMIGVVPSIEMVVWVAVGGRQSLLGALIGTVLVNLGRDVISSAWPDAWLYVMGLLFVLVVVVMPRGLSGVGEAAWAWIRARSDGAAPVANSVRTTRAESADASDG
jgi:urea transport system permease protein